MGYTIPIQYPFCQIQRIAPHSSVAVCSVCALKKKKNPVFLHSAGSVNGKQEVAWTEPSTFQPITKWLHSCLGTGQEEREDDEGR